MHREQFSDEYQTGLREKCFVQVRGSQLNVPPPRIVRSLRCNSADDEILTVKSLGRDYEGRPPFRTAQVGEWERNQDDAAPT